MSRARVACASLSFGAAGFVSLSFGAARFASISSVASFVSVSSVGCSSGVREARPDSVASRPPSFSSVASSLGLASDDDSCRYSASELTLMELSQRDTSRLSLSRHWGCLALRDNIERDSLEGCLPDATVAMAGRVGKTRIEGTLAYMGFVALPYRYDLGTDHEGHAVVRVRVHYSGTLADRPENLQHMARKLHRAAEIWTENAPAAEFDGPPVTFTFEVVAAPEHAHFAVELAPGCPRAAYLAAHGLNCSPHFLAHELGHMLGIDDEYNQVRKTTGHVLGAEWWWARNSRLRTETFRCEISSLMCSSRFDASVPRAYDYYLILRRRLCESGKQRDQGSRVLVEAL
jgi:hypothetical protein